MHSRLITFRRRLVLFVAGGLTLAAGLVPAAQLDLSSATIPALPAETITY